MTARAAVLAAVAVVLAVAVIILARGCGGGRRHGRATERDFGDRLRELAARRGADSRHVDADDPIRKIGGVFVRSWWINLPSRKKVKALAVDIEAEVPRWQATFRREAPQGEDVARVRFGLGREAFDIHLRVPTHRRVQPKPTTPPRPTRTPRPTLAPGVRGRLAILLDDAGQRMDVVPAIVALPRPVAVAVLPFLPHSVEVAAAVHRAGHEVWLHLPMEPNGYPRRDPGPGAVLVRMAESQVRETVRAAMNNVPYIVGVNNHMGSRATADLRLMTWVMQEIAGRGLAFIDSRTTAATVAEEAARMQGIPAGRRNVFLDNSRSPATIRRQLAEAVDYARRHGSAIAVGHMHPTTLRVLARELPRLSARGADLVAPTRLLR